MEIILQIWKLRFFLSLKKKLTAEQYLHFSPSLIICVFLSVFDQFTFIATNDLFGLSFTIMLYFLITTLYPLPFFSFPTFHELIKSSIFLSSYRSTRIGTAFANLFDAVCFFTSSCVLIISYSPHFYPRVMGMANHMTPNPGQFIGHIYSLPRGGGNNTPLCRVLWGLCSGTEWTTKGCGRQAL